MSASSREFMLGEIRRALRVENSELRRGECARERQALPRGYRVRGGLEQVERTGLFEQRVADYNGAAYYSRGAVRAGIGEILTERGKRVLIVPPGFPQEWLPDGFMFVADEDLSYEQLNSSDGAVTCCRLAIAETGTVVLDGSPEQGRRAVTLIPDYHLCVLRESDIVELPPEAFRILENAKHRPLTFVSGPSATVDIEMTRVRGVHGPRMLDVLII